jgi:PhoPQ-activated pathogenicity-related protein
MKTKALIFSFLVSFLFFQSCRTKEQVQVVNSKNALESYISKPDSAFQWSVTDSFELEGIKGYQLIMTSQVWQGITWKHQLTVFVPTEVDYTSSLLFISGGHNKESEPELRSNTDDLATDLAHIAIKNKAVVSLLRQTPNQPLFGDLTEDALISYTLHNFKKDGDYNWPLLFPMVKSAIKGMDAIQEFGKQNLNKEIEKFTISGYSKRGWTTWLTGSQDSRVEAIGPMVIDVLNMPVSLQYQISTWNDYSIEIQDYVSLEIPQSMASDTGTFLVDMIDPYSYRKKLTMPKMIFIGTNDPYWPIDAIKNYYDSIPGENYIHYVPNAGHDLAGGKQAMEALGSFFGNTIQKKAYPKCTWTTTATEKGLAINIKASADKLVDVIVWTANSEDRDFRNDKWTSKSLGIKNVDNVEVLESYPKNNFKAQYVDFKYQDATGGTFTESTRTFVTNADELL